MKDNVTLTITSLLLSLLLTLHLADDIVRGYENGGLANLIAVPIVVLWLYATLVLTGRKSGYIITLLLSLFALFVPYVHMKGRGVGLASLPYVHMKGRGVGLASRVAHSSAAFFFVWTLLAIAVLGLFGVVLSARGLWRLPWRRAR